jgi:hypothetical protein
LSAVTKVLVVLLVVFSIAFSMQVIGFAARTEQWKELAEGYQTEAQLANAQSRLLMAADAANLATARDTIKGHLDRILELEEKLQNETERLASQGGEIAQLQTDKRRSDALAQRLTNELGIAQAARSAVEEQRQQFESRNIDLERRNIDLNERVNELTTQVAVLDQKQRQQAQQIHLLREQTSSLAGGQGVIGATGGHDRPSAFKGAPRVKGHVAFVDGDLVTLSVGSADRVDSGMVFVISRGTQYIGDIKISDVEPNLSTGRIVRSAPGMSPEKGDAVEDEFHFATP